MTRKLPKATAETLDGIRQRPATEPAPADLILAEPVDPAAATPAGPDPVRELRRARAREAVERHATYAAIGGLIPMPLLDTMSVVATIALMLQAVAQIYGVTLQRDRARTLVASLVGGLGQAGAGAATTATLSKLVPGANLVGLMMSSIAAAALTRTIGRAFILHFETGGTALQLAPDALRAYFAAESPSQPISRQ